MLAKGQTVYLEGTKNSHIIQGEVIGISEKYYTIKANGGNLKFDRETLEQRTNYSVDYRLFASEQEIYDERERVKLFYVIRTAFDDYGKIPLTLEELRRIKDVLDSRDKEN